MPAENPLIGYSSWTGLVFVFNVVVGTGALALPGVINRAGYIPGSLLILLLSFFSYITVTFIVETQSIGNFIQRNNSRTRPNNESNDEDHPLLENENENHEGFEISKKLEFSELSSLLLNTPAKCVVHFCMIFYLFGDLSVYCAVIGKTMSHTTCTFRPDNYTCDMPIPDDALCWDSSNVTRLDVYKLWVGVFVAAIGPLVFFNLQKTKVLQIVTTAMRWIAFIVMIVWSVILTQKGGGRSSSPILADVQGFPALFGTCVYSFMCQHSVPGLVHPVTNKAKFLKLLPFDYLIIACFYILLSVTAVFAFDKIEDLYTLNFWSDTCSEFSSLEILDYYLALFPVFTLSTSFPIIGITLKNNLVDLLLGGRPGFFLKQILIPSTVIILPAILALFVPNVQTLVSYVGSYAGSGLQYLAPCLLISAARFKMTSGSLNQNSNPYQSPFRSNLWIIIVQLWMAVSLILITANNILKLTNV